jgi:hypothetical protein
VISPSLDDGGALVVGWNPERNEKRGAAGGRAVARLIVGGWFTANS